MLDWKHISAKNVIDAIHMFEISNEEYPAPKNTFLEYAGKKYPAKHIRALSYKAAFGVEAPKSEFSGGEETVRFFEKLGFKVMYLPRDGKLPKLNKQNDLQYTKSINISTSQNVDSPIIKTREIKIPAKGVIEQKNAFQLALNRYFNGDIVSEKTFDWMTTPTNVNEYPYLVSALRKYRGMSGFNRAGYKLRCDFVCESKKLIFEYDERQHFSLARKAALESYMDFIPLHFDKQRWIDTCQNIQAKDNDPINRDEIRAYYDSIRDIQSAQNGYKLIRIMHGAYDWNELCAKNYIKELLDYKPTIKSKPFCFDNNDNKHATVKIGNSAISDEKEESVIAVTATLQHESEEAPDNRYRTELLKNIILESKSSDIILLPAGFFSYRILDLNKIKIMIKVITSILCELSSNAAICLGVDCEDGKDQLAFAIDQSGVLAVARKFYPTLDEKFCINAADQFDDKEMGYSRIFTKNGKKFYLAVCYDVFGIRHKNIPNPGVDVILVLAHCFYPRGDGPSGEVDFARKGFAGASQQWKCPVLGTGVFFYRKIPEKWPTGVIWNAYGKSVKSFKYSDNQLTSDREKTIFVSDESTLLRRYQL